MPQCLRTRARALSLFLVHSVKRIDAGAFGRRRPCHECQNGRAGEGGGARGQASGAPPSGEDGEPGPAVGEGGVAGRSRHDSSRHNIASLTCPCPARLAMVQQRLSCCCVSLVRHLRATNMASRGCRPAMAAQSAGKGSNLCLSLRATQYTMSKQPASAAAAATPLSKASRETWSHCLRHAALRRTAGCCDLSMARSCAAWLALSQPASTWSDKIASGDVLRCAAGVELAAWHSGARGALRCPPGGSASGDVSSANGKGDASSAFQASHLCSRRLSRRQSTCWCPCESASGDEERFWQTATRQREESQLVATRQDPKGSLTAAAAASKVRGSKTTSGCAAMSPSKNSQAPDEAASARTSGVTGKRSPKRQKTPTSAPLAALRAMGSPSHSAPRVPGMKEQMWANKPAS